MKQLLLIELLKQAGALALEHQKNLDISTKSDTSMVTNGDIAVSAFLETNLKKLYPEFDVFSEENAENIPTKGKIIVIDPIDGTQSYSRKQDTWAILVGFIEEGVITQGYIYQPTLNLFYYAQKGQGAFKLENNVSTPLKADRSGPTVSYSSPSRTDENEFLQELKIDDRRFMYSASLKIMEIAQGKADFYPNFQFKCSLWDLVAPEIILNESGGIIIYETHPGINFQNPNIATRFCAVGPRFKNFKF